MYTPYEGPDGMLLERKGKLTMWKSKSSRLSQRAIPENIHPTPPMDDTELGIQKCQEGQLQFLQDSRAYWFKILRNSRISEKFELFSWNSSLKFTKFWGYLWISSNTHWAFLTGFPMSSMGCVWIFYGIAQYSLVESLIHCLWWMWDQGSLPDHLIC